MNSTTWASPRYVQELATILGPQNRTQGSCVAVSHEKIYGKKAAEHSKWCNNHNRRVASRIYANQTACLL